MAAGTAACAPPALACGMALDASVPSEQALISYANGREEMTMKVVLDTTGPQAALVTPVPGIPDRPSVVKGDLFGYLNEVTAPKDDGSDGGGGAGATAAPMGGVDVIGRDVVGDYDIARLAADDPRQLQRWLADNGYTPPRGAAPILRAYVREGWKFVAIKLRKGARPNGPIQPVRVSFPSPTIIYPMRLDALESHQMDMDIFVLADRGVQSDQLTARFFSKVADLGRPPPADIRRLFRAPYLTRFHSVINPSGLRGDFVFARSGLPDRLVSDPFPWLAVVLVALPLLALTAVGVVLTRRRRRRPGPPA